MKPWLAITRLLGILAVLALVTAPFTVAAVAGGMNAPKATAMADAGCCAPAQSSDTEGPKACPLAALCHAKVVQGVSTASAALRWFHPAQSPAPGNDADPATLAQAPPSRPPQA